MESNALASSIVLVCRKRPADAPVCTRRDFMSALHRELPPALAKLQAANIAPVDLAQSAIGPGMAVYSRFKAVLEANGMPMTVREALQAINAELDSIIEPINLDSGSRFCLSFYEQYAYNDVKYGDADNLARAKNTSVQALAQDGVLSAAKGIVRLLGRDELVTFDADKKGEPDIWLITQQLTQAMAKDGVEGTAKMMLALTEGGKAQAIDQAKALLYRLYTLSERKGWAQEAYAYNSLVIAWPDVQTRMAELSTSKPETGSLFG
jgi:putative DNA methylase